MSDGRSYVQTNTGAADSTRWVSQWKDRLARDTITVRPAFGSTATTFDQNFAANNTAVSFAATVYDDTAGRSSTGHVLKTTHTGGLLHALRVRCPRPVLPLRHGPDG